MAFFPYTYDHTTHTLSRVTSMDVVMNYQIGQAGDEGVPFAIARQSLSALSPMSTTIRPMLPESVIQFDSIEVCPGIGNTVIPGINPPLNEFERRIKGYEFTIVTSAELAPAFERLAALRRQKGIDAGVVTMEYIRGLRKFDSGDMYGINDDAGRLRGYLQFIYEYKNCKYVLLGGAPEHVPIRYGTNIFWKHGGVCLTDVFSTPKNRRDNAIPTDLYFSEFNQDWSSPYANEYGFYNENVYVEEFNFDYDCEIGVGRLLCRNAREVENYIDKLEIYELNPGKGDSSYLTSAIYFLSYQFGNDSIYIDRGLERIIDSRTIKRQFSKSDTHPRGAECIQYINEIRPGILSFHCHGNPMGFQTAYPTDNGTYGINALDAERRYHWIEEGNGLDNLTNKDYPFVSSSISCEVTPFDIYLDYTGSMNIGQSITLGQNYGGVAFIGNTRYGYSGVTGSLALETGFWQKVSEHPYHYAGEGIKSARNIQIKLCKNHFLRLTNNLIGDPCLNIWTKTPEEISDLTIDYSQDSFTINSTSLNGAVIGTTLISNYPVSFKDINEENSVAISGKYNKAICIYGDAILPKFLPIYLKNIELSGLDYFYCSGLYINEFSTINDKVIFNNHANYTFIVDGDVHLSDALQINEGASMIIKATGDVFIDNISVLPNGHLEIYCRECFLTNNNFPESAIVKINNIR